MKESKSRHESSLPLPREVGEALAAYLQKGRPHTKERCIFVSHAFPIGQPLSPSAVRIAIRRAFQRCALHVPSYGTHVLRRTLATQLLQGANNSGDSILNTGKMSQDKIMHSIQSSNP